MSTPVDMPDPMECGCPGACECADERDPHVIGAWVDWDHAHDPMSNELRGDDYPLSVAAQNHHATPSPRGVVGPPAGREGASETRRALTPVPNFDELAARRNTRPLSSTVDNVVPIRRTRPTHHRDPLGGSAA